MNRYTAHQIVSNTKIDVMKKTLELDLEIILPIEIEDIEQLFDESDKEIKAKKILNYIFNNLK